MEEWKEYKLGNILQISSGFAYKGKDIGYGNNCLLGMGCVSFKEKFLKSGIRNYNGDCPEKYCVKPNDMVLATRQQSDNLPILGMPAIIPDDLKGDKIIVGANLYKVENKSDFDSQYIYWLLKSPSYVDYIRSCQTGTTVRMITKANIESYSFLAPNKKCRDRIVSILSSLDDKIEVNRRINEQLEELAGALFKSWFVDFEPFKDGGFVESELGMIPEGWKVGTLGELCVTNKRTYGSKFSSEIAYLDTGSVTRNNIESLQTLDPNKNKIPSRARRAVTEGDIVFSSVRPNQKHYAFLFNPQSNMVVSTGFVVITANWSGYRYFIYQYLIQEDIIAKLQAIAEQSVSTYPSINATDITNLQIVIPRRDVIGKFAEINLSFMNEINKNQREISRLTTLRDTLLPKLMSGEIEVEQLNVIE